MKVLRVQGKQMVCTEGLPWAQFSQHPYRAHVLIVPFYR